MSCTLSFLQLGVGRLKLKFFYSYSGCTQPLTKEPFSIYLMHIIIIRNDKRLQAVALDKCRQFLKNLDILRKDKFE